MTESRWTWEVERANKLKNALGIDETTGGYIITDIKTGRKFQATVNGIKFTGIGFTKVNAPECLRRMISDWNFTYELSSFSAHIKFGLFDGRYGMSYTLICPEIPKKDQSNTEILDTIEKLKIQWEKLLEQQAANNKQYVQLLQLLETQREKDLTYFKQLF